MNKSYLAIAAAVAPLVLVSGVAHAANPATIPDLGLTLTKGSIYAVANKTITPDDFASTLQTYLAANYHNLETLFNQISSFTVIGSKNGKQWSETVKLNVDKGTNTYFAQLSSGVITTQLTSVAGLAVKVGAFAPSSQSFDLRPVPGPIAGAGLLPLVGLGLGFGGLSALRRRKAQA